MLEALRRRPLATCAVASVGVMAFAWRRFLGGRHSPFASDIAHFHHPVTVELARAWSEGRLPLWTDRIYFGFPILADPQTAAWYPATLLVAGLGPHAGYVAFLLLHSLLAVLGTLGWVRSHGGGFAAGWAAGVTLALSGYFAHEAQHPQLFAILAWIPAWLWAIHAVFRRPTPRSVAAAALAVAAMIFAGTLQVLLGAVMIGACYAAGLFAAAWADRGARQALRALAAAAAAQGLGLAVSAVSLLPAVAHLPLTARSLGLEYGFGSMGSVSPLELLSSLAPSAASGLPADQRSFGGASFYLGALALPLAAVGLAAARRALAVSLGLAIGLCAWLALGRHGSLHPFLWEALPHSVGGLLGPGRALGPASACVALLAGIGLHHLGEGGAPLRRALLAALAAGLACQAWALATTPEPARTAALGAAAVTAGALVVAGLLRQSPQRLRAALAALVALDLLAFGALDGVLSANPPPPGDAEIAGLLPALAGVERDAAGNPAGRVLLAGFGPRNLPLVRGFDGVGGYNPLVMLQYLDFVELLVSGQPFPREPLDRFVHHFQPERPEAALFDAASIRWVVATAPIAAEGFRRIGRYPGLPPGRIPTWLYENTGALPRAYLAYRTERAAGPEDAAALLGDGFDGRRATVVEGGGPALEGPEQITPVERIRERPERLRFDIAPERPALLVVTDTWYPGWRAWVDGAPAPVLRANAHFRGVPIPAGARRVEMRFEPGTFRAGAGISLAALLAIAGLFCVRR